MHPGEKQILFVIDTDSYAGNFERECCAFVTGRTGDCEVGAEIVSSPAMLKDTSKEEAKALKWLDRYVGGDSDEHGCFRPVSIYPTPGWGNNGNGKEAKLTSTNKKVYRYPSYQSIAIFLDKMPSKATIAAMKARAQRFFASPPEGSYHSKYGGKKKIKVLGFRLVKTTANASDAAL